MERIKIRELRSQVKVMGTLVTLAGAMLMTLYKGPEIHLFHSDTTHYQNESHSPQSHKNWVTGTLFILLGCVAWSSFYILQVNYIHAFKYKFILNQIYEACEWTLSVICMFWCTTKCECEEQSITVRRYPAELSLSSLICLMGALQSAVVALVADHHSKSWVIGWDFRLFGPLYTVSTTIPFHLFNI